MHVEGAPVQAVQYSVVIPIFNEDDGLRELFRRLNDVRKKIKGTTEIIFVSDGSSDGSMEILSEFCSNDKLVRAVELSRNFGHQVAITAGLQYASGNAVIVMDGDLQDPPEIIPQLIEKWEKGHDVVYAVRKKRKEGLFKRISYRAFYRILRAIVNIRIPLDSGDFCIMDRKVVELINSMPEKNRFIRGLRSWVGFNQTSLEYEREARYAGDVKYTFIKLLKLALDGIVSFSYIPLRVVSIFGFLVSLAGFFGILFVLYLRLSERAIPGTATIIILILFIGGVQLIAIGIGGEYIGRIYDEVKNRPQYIVKRSIGFKDTK